MSAIFDGLVRTSWQVALLVVLVLLTQRLLAHRLTARWRYGLWLLVVARMAFPFSMELPVGLYDWELPGVARVAPENESAAPRSATIDCVVGRASLA